MREHDQPKELTGQYRSVPGEKDRNSIGKIGKTVTMPHSGYNSVNDKRRVNSRDQGSHFSIKMQARNGPAKRGYM